LNEYENKYGVKFDWIANIHESEGHPHCHVIIKGVSDKKGCRGYTRIRFSKEQLKDMRNIFEKHFERDVKYRFWELESVKSAVKDTGRALESFAMAIKKELKKEQSKNDFEKMLELNKLEYEKRKDRDR